MLFVVDNECPALAIYIGGECSVKHKCFSTAFKTIDVGRIMIIICIIWDKASGRHHA